eukprot:5152727-Lingulodinium_polyedra.AAC.1
MAQASPDPAERRIARRSVARYAKTDSEKTRSTHLKIGCVSMWFFVVPRLRFGSVGPVRVQS